MRKKCEGGEDEGGDEEDYEDDYDKSYQVFKCSQVIKKDVI